VLCGFREDIKSPPKIRWAVPLVEAIKGGECTGRVLLCVSMSNQKLTAFLPDVYAEDGKQGNECKNEKDVHGRNSSGTTPYYHPSIINNLRTP